MAGGLEIARVKRWMNDNPNSTMDELIEWYNGWRELPTQEHKEVQP